MDKMETLHNIYEDINRWLLFAEAKHIAIITFMSFIISAAIDNVRYLNEAPWWLELLFFASCSVGTGISLISFIPFLNDRVFLKKRCYNFYANKDTKNVIFYLSIFCMVYRNGDEYEEQFKKKIGAASLEDMEKQYVEQIKAVATVTTVKYYLFEVAVRVLCCGAISLFIIFFYVVRSRMPTI